MDTTLKVKAKLERTMRRARTKGLDTSRLEQQLQRIEQARAVASRTRELLDTRGWCKWRCQALRGEVIIVASDSHVTGMPAGLPVGFPAYTEAELLALTSGKVRPSTIRLVHEAKKTMHATIITETTHQPGGTE